MHVSKDILDEGCKYRYTLPILKLAFNKMAKFLVYHCNFNVGHHIKSISQQLS